MNLYFVTGTDTEVGKTTVACALLRRAAARSKTVWAWKPIESGCALLDGRLHAADAEALAEAASVAPPFRSPAFSFADAVAPGVAAARAGVDIDFDAIVPLIARAAPAADFALVEGAGGLLVPLSATRDIVDLAVALTAPLIVVARAGLGTLNHTLLTLSLAASRKLPVAAVILNDTAPDTPAGLIDSNLEELRRRTDVPVLGALPHSPDPAQPLFERAVAALDLSVLGIH